MVSQIGGCSPVWLLASKPHCLVLVVEQGDCLLRACACGTIANTATAVAITRPNAAITAITIGAVLLFSLEYAMRVVKSSMEASVKE